MGQALFCNELLVGYGYWARGFGPWAVWVAKKGARAISTLLSAVEAT